LQHEINDALSGRPNAGASKDAIMNGRDCLVNPDFTIWLDMVWEALEEDLTKRERMLQDAHRALDQLRPQDPERPVDATDAA
jgi:hypothetical protein